MTEIALLDGGLGQEISKRSAQTAHPLWSVKVMLDTPELVVDVQAEFIDAGARIITANTYTATPTRMQRHDLGERFEEAQELAFELAHQAIDQSSQSLESVQIAGCLPPLVASYRAEVSQDYENSLSEFQLIVEQQHKHADLFLIETMSNTTESLAALDAAMASGKPVYIGLTIDDSSPHTLRSGENLVDVVETIASKSPDGVLLNCSIPEAITEAIPALAQTGIRFGAYANGFTSIDKLAPGGTVDVLEARQDLTPDAYTKHVEQWISEGATIVGGCCEVGPAHIKHIADRLISSGHTLTHLG